MWKPTSVSTFDLKGLRVSLKELLQAWQSAYQIAPSINCDLSETCTQARRGPGRSYWDTTKKHSHDVWEVLTF